MARAGERSSRKSRASGATGEPEGGESRDNRGGDWEPLAFGGMARLHGIDFFGPGYMSVADRRGSEIELRIDHSRSGPPRSPLVRRVSRWPLVRSGFFWGRLLLQLVGSVRGVIALLLTLLVLWLFTLLLEFGGRVGGDGLFGDALNLFATFPVLPLLLLLFAGMKFTAIGRYHGAEHKAVAAYERDGEVTLPGAKRSGRIHPRCGTNILIYIILASLLAPVISWPPYAVLQFVLISEAWYVLGDTRASIAAGNFLQRYFTTSEPRRAELEVAVESLQRLVKAEAGEMNGEIGKTLQIPARF
ncbi:DUF1385 domain-containing protein [Rubrobacter aplysinae]|uniref:DUF1385 domain-containing protein n=1 Tax=Rubrobacter aplysinae TaxID=909625 RepID=UPI00064C39A3|nr:DUF1385 domain-containing protein [Rubrobacter aplysinae]